MDRIAVLKSYLEKTPDDSFLKHALALEYLKLHEENKAIRLFEELLAHDPDYIGSYYHWGKALVKTGDTQKALAIFQKGIEIARKLKDTHAAAELQQAEDDLL
ncbi:MAG: tetratricopeptide repeat protein [Chitinophagaceae bacterium]|nr:MAG: tetratricopeptide repeat protein [Chitinophagaceae bacterium]